MIVNEYPALRVCRVDFKTYILLIIKKFFFKSVKYTDSLYTNLNFGSFLKKNWLMFVTLLFVPSLAIIISYKKSTNADVFDLVVGLATSFCTIVLGLFLYYKTWLNDKAQYFANGIHVSVELLFDDKNFGLFSENDIDSKNYQTIYHGGGLNGTDKNCFVGIELINLNNDIPIKIEYKEMYISQMTKGIKKFGKLSTNEITNIKTGELIDYKQNAKYYLGFDNSILNNYDIDANKAFNFCMVYKVSNLRNHSCYLIITLDVNEGHIYSISQVLVGEKVFKMLKEKYGHSIVTKIETEIIVVVYLFNKNLTPILKHLDRKFYMIDYIYFRKINRFFKEEKVEYIDR